jgi:hypothetical protein
MRQYNYIHLSQRISIEKAFGCLQEGSKDLDIRQKWWKKALSNHFLFDCTIHHSIIDYFLAEVDNFMGEVSDDEIMMSSNDELEIISRATGNWPNWQLLKTE